ncbi:MAG: hypothetical protein WC836_22395 [Desulfobacula sp.]|jgi:hypothetical protein
MAEEKLRLDIDRETGDQVVCIAKERVTLVEREVDDLIVSLTAGKSSSARWKEALRIQADVSKEYNGIGKSIESKLKTAEEAKEISDDAGKES